DVPPTVGAGLLGVVVDAWDAGQADVGPAGEDQGKGGKYLLVPPDFSGAPPAGYIVVRFQTFNGYGLLRAIPAGSTAAEVEASLNLVKKLRLYPFAQAANPPEQRFIDLHDKTFDGVAKFDDTFFDSLARMVLEEPVQTRDLAVMGMLKSVGIEKGKPFNPAAIRTMLKAAVEEAEAFFLDKITNYSNPFLPDLHSSTLVPTAL